MVLFANDEWVLIFDTLSGAGEHQIESHFKFAPLPHEMTEHGLRTCCGDGDLEVRLLHPSHAASTLACGQSEPFAGWHFIGEHQQAPSPRLTFTTKGTLPCSFITLLAPFRADEERMETRVEENAGEVTLLLRRQDREWRLTCGFSPLEISLNGGELHFQATEREGVFLCEERPRAPKF